MRRRGTILISAGVVLSVLTGVLVYTMLNRPAAAPSEAGALEAAGPTVPVPAAARPLSAGTTITTTDIVQRDYPADLLPVGVVTDTNAVVGQTLGDAVQQGELFRPAGLHSGGGSLSRELEPNKVAMVFPLDALLQQSAAIDDGDHVDLLLTLTVNETSAAGTRAGPSTSLTLQNIRVLRVVRADAAAEGSEVSAGGAVGPAQGLVLEMTPQDAVIAKYVKDSGGTIDLILRSPENTEPFAAESINQDYLLDRYRFRAPVSGSAPSP